MEDGWTYSDVGYLTLRKRVRKRERVEGVVEGVAAKMGLMESTSMVTSVVRLGEEVGEGERWVGRAIEVAKCGERRRAAGAGNLSVTQATV
jgi:hypothetical protein